MVEFHGRIMHMEGKKNKDKVQKDLEYSSFKK